MICHRLEIISANKAKLYSSTAFVAYNASVSVFHLKKIPAMWEAGIGAGCEVSACD
jgi:hypothetical protein